MLPASLSAGRYARRAVQDGARSWEGAAIHVQRGVAGGGDDEFVAAAGLGGEWPPLTICGGGFAVRGVADALG
jgi:hypothetical protein